MAALRTPGTGCPWDLDQDFASIAPYTVEEAYEVADAIARGDKADLRDELGDLLLQVVFHARMAEEEGSFAFPDVVEAITTKLIRRHPHVFGDARDLSPAEVKAAVKPFRVPRFHRTLSEWVAMIVAAGLAIEHMAEPRVDAQTARAVPYLADTRVAPLFLHIRARKGAPA